MDMPHTGIEVRRPRVRSASFRALEKASRAEGYWMLTRLLAGWRDGSNRFSRRGEALYGAFYGDELVGVCGLNVDPYIQGKREGRVRHLYVAAPFRRHGAGRILVRSAIAKARDHFPALNVRATDEAFPFYEKLGFMRIEGEEFMTHRMEFQPLRRRPPLGKGHE